jgi:hypothetical protein
MYIERACHQGIHPIRYSVPPQDWTDHDIEMLMVLLYRFLPTNEPRWRESGAITQAKLVAPPEEGSRVTIAPCLQVGRGDYVAHLRLPAFPARALANWLASRHYDINLRHPVIKLELIARGWRCAATTKARSPEIQSPAVHASGELHREEVRTRQAARTVDPTVQP